LRENSLARRYALGLIKSIKDEKEYLGIKGELEGFLELLETNPEFKAGMETLLFSKQQKRELLDTIREKAGLADKTYNFIKAMMDENRMPALPVVVQVLGKLWLEKNGIERLKVFTAVELSEKLEQKLVDKLEKSFEKKVILDKEIDESLIAGLKIQRESVFYDFSIEGNLKKIKEAILSDAHGADAFSKEQ